MMLFRNLVVIAVVLLVSGGIAQADPSPDAGASLPGPPLELKDLPRLPPIAADEPKPKLVQQLDEMLGRLTSGDARDRELALKGLEKVEPAMVDAMRRRVQPIRESIDRKKAPILLDNARKAAKKARRAAKKKGREEPPAEWLEFLLDDPQSADDGWRDLVRLLAMTRMLAAIGDTPACRELIEYRSYFGDMLRVDLERKLEKLKDRAVPALIEARRHDAQVVQRWSNKLLDRMGRAIAGEAVASTDPVILADVLRAFGRTRDVDAVRVILSFSNHDREVVRQAAREAIGAIGKPARWQLRDAYLGLTGEKAPRSKSWEMLAKEIFARYDRMRLAEIYLLYDRGAKAAEDGRHPDAVTAFDQVLARDPRFPQRREMAASYVARAKDIEAESLEESLAMLRKALRLQAEGADVRLVEADIAYLEARVLMKRGIPDRFLLERALELNPDHARARDALASFEVRVAQRKESYRRYFYAGGVFLLALIALIFLARRRSEPRRPGGSPPAASEPPEPAGET